MKLESDKTPAKRTMLVVRISDDELATLKQLCKQNNLNASEVVRALIRKAAK